MATKTHAEKEQEEIIERTAPRGQVIYQAIYAEGDHELRRNPTELAFSGLAAGSSMGFSMVTEALLRHYLPDASWTPLVSKLGYSVGFLIVILGRQQLFTKNTLTVILPLLRLKQPGMLRRVGKLWATVLLTNLIGAFVFAWLAAKTGAFVPDVREIFSTIGRTAIEPDFGTLFLRGILAGWLIALMVWLLPFAEAARIWVIVILAYVVGLAELPHIIAGGVEVFYLVVAGSLGFMDALLWYLLPTLLGNVIGGVALVAVGAHAEFFEAEKKTR